MDSPKLKKKAVRLLAEGKNPPTVAKEIGVSAPTVYKFEARDDIRDMIEKEQLRLAEVVPVAIDNMRDLVTDFPNMRDTEERKLGFAATRDVLKSHGLLPSPQPSQTFVNIYQQQNINAIPPIIQNLLKQQNEEIKKLAGQTYEGEIIETEGGLEE